MAVTRTVILTSGTTWQVPNTWNNLDNWVACIGAGAGGTNQTGAGGGGGAYVRSNNVTLTPNSTISIIIGAGGAANTDGGYTSFASNTVLAQGGKANTQNSGPWGTGGAGGSIAASIGEMKWSGGAGGNGYIGWVGGGGGGAGGNTSNGLPGANSANVYISPQVAGSGGFSGNTGRANGGSAGNGTASESGYNGWEWATGNTYYGKNYAGGGGGGGSYVSDDTGTGYFNGGNGGLYGGGGGGAANASAGVGGQGAIIATWTYQSIVPTSGAVSASNVAIILDRNPLSQISINEADVRDLYRNPTLNSQISFADGRGYTSNSNVVGTSATTGSVSSTLAFPSGWKAGDLAVLFIINADGTASPAGTPTVPTLGWDFLPGSRTTYAAFGYTAAVFTRILQTGDSAPTFTQNLGGAYMIVFRNASKATVIQALNATTATTVSFTGFTKNADSRKLLTIMADRSLVNGTAPSGWTEHTAQALTYFRLESATVNSASYVNGTTISWTYSARVYGTQGVLMEIT